MFSKASSHAIDEEQAAKIDITRTENRRAHAAADIICINFCLLSTYIFNALSEEFYIPDANYRIKIDSAGLIDQP